MSHYRACSRCGRIHDSNAMCPKMPRVYPKTPDRQLRNTYDWQEKSKEIREKANYLCEVCRDRGEHYTYTTLEVHHIEKLKDHPTLLLDNYNLVCLCNMHHRQADAGELSKDYLKKLAQEREEN